jgi:hypothetical protein
MLIHKASSTVLLGTGYTATVEMTRARQTCLISNEVLRW